MKKKGFTLIELLVVISIIAMLLAILMPALGRVKEMAQRVVCGTNCKGLGTSMIIYASDYDDSFPVSGEGDITGAFDTWGDPSWAYDNTTYDFAAQGEDMTVSSSLFLLIKEVDGDPASFICKSGDEVEFDIPSGVTLDLTELHDFGPSPLDNVSYAYQLPYKVNANSMAVPANGNKGSSFAVLADKSPMCDPSLEQGTATADNYLDIIDRLSDDWSVGNSPNKKWQNNAANSAAHKREGQNVLFGDGHASFEKRPDVGVRNDNIYNMQINRPSETGRRRSKVTPGLGAGEPKTKTDSYLVNDGSHK